MDSARSRREAEHMDRIRHALRNKKLVIIVGATVSLTATHPSPPRITWTGLLRDGLDYLKESGFVAPDDEELNFYQRLLQQGNANVRTMLRVCSYLKDELDHYEQYPTWLESVFGSLHHDVTHPEIFEALNKFHQRGARLLTTNYDELLEHFCNLPRVRRLIPEDVRKYEQGTLDGVFHIHGSFQDPNEVVLDGIGYYQVRTSDNVQNLLKTYLGHNTILFIGYGSGLEDPNFDALLKWASNRDRNIPHHHYLLVRDRDNHRYDPLITLKYGQSYEGLTPYLHRLLDDPSKVSNKEIFTENLLEGPLQLLPYAAKAPFNAYGKEYDPFCLPITRVEMLNNMRAWTDGERRGILQEIVELTQGAKYDLRTVASALYNSADDQHIPRCLQGTRVGILSRITAWVNDVDSETIFWVYGPAGTGKSTITRTLAHSLADTGQLGASYFFRRGEEGRNGTARFFPTIASQLIATIPTFKIFLRKSLERLGNTKVEEKSLGEQFKTLILTPLSEMVPETSARVIVIDALDECEHSNDISLICSLLSQLQELITIRLRVFLTSRSAHPIVGAFEDLKNNDTAYRSLALHEEFSADTKADISAFLRARFASIKAKQKITEDPWPDPKDLDRLLTLATNPSPLFIYAATLCRFVYDETGRKNPTRRLKLWLKDCDSNAPQLDQIYMPILNQVLFGTYEEGKVVDPLNNEDQLQVLLILSSIVLLATPLPAQGLASLLNMKENDVNHWLRNLHAVLNVPRDRNTPVEILHKSFSDFLLGQEETGTDSCRVNAVETHAMLVSKCIQRMKSINGLRRDICNLQEPGKSRDEVDNAIVASHIPPDLEYACLYWVHHLQHSARRITDGDEVYDFLLTHFLHWVESLSLLRRLSEGILSIRELLKTVQSIPSTNLPLTRFLKDAERFVISYGSIIRQAPLQTYGAALAFCPTRSELKQRCWEQRLPFIRNVKGIRNGWDSFLQTLEGHGGSVNSIAFSPDGKILASASYDETVRLWYAATGSHKQTLEGHGGCVNSVAFSPDGETLASGSDDRTVRLWDATTGAHKQTLDGHGNYVRAVAFSPDGKILASASGDGMVRLWDATTGIHKKTLEGHGGYVNSVAFSSDSKILASASGDGTVRLWDTTIGVHMQTLDGHAGCINSVVFSPDGKMLASASDDRMVRLWDAALGAYKQTLTGHTNYVGSVAFSPDGKILVSVSGDKTVRLWDASIGAHLQTLDGHRSYVRAVAFSPGGKIFASASGDKTVRLWDTSTGAYKQTLDGNYIRAVTFSPDGKMLASVSGDTTVWSQNIDTDTHKETFNSHGGWVRAVAFSPDGKILASASGDKMVRFWDATTGAHKQTLDGHCDWVNSVVFSRDGKTLVSASSDGTVRLWDVTTGSHKQTLNGHGGWVNSVAFSPDGKVLTSASGDGTVRLWDAATGVHKQTLDGHGDWVNSVTFSPDGKILASASDDKTIRLWDVSTGTHLRTLDGHGGRVRAVAFSPDGKILASVSGDKTVRLWDPSTYAYLQTLRGHRGYVRAVAFSPHGRILASASADGTLRRWDASIGAHIQTLNGHGDWVNSVAFSPDGRILASASDDRTVRLWDAATGAHKQTLDGHGNYIRAVAFSPDGKILASVSGDKTVRLWDATTGTTIQILDGHCGRVNSVAFSPDGKILVSASGDQTVQLWDARTGIHQQTLSGHRGFIRAIAFSPDGKTLASASGDQTVRLWDAGTGAHKKTLKGHGSWVNSVAFSLDSKMLASASGDGTGRLWDTITGTLIQTLGGHRGYVRAVAFSPDSKILASASDDRTLRLWDTAIGTHIQTLDGHGGWIRAVAFSPDGKTLASASDDRTVRLWDTATGTHKQTLEVNLSLECLSFSEDSRYLKTDRGLLSLGSSLSGGHLDRKQLICTVFVNRDWVTRDGQNVIWLPPDYRATCATFCNNVLVLGHETGQVTFLEIS